MVCIRSLSPKAIKVVNYDSKIEDGLGKLIFFSNLNSRKPGTFHFRKIVGTRIPKNLLKIIKVKNQ